MVNLGVGIALFSVLCWTAYNMLAKAGTVGLGNKKAAMLITAAGTVPMAILLLIFGIQWPGIYPFILSILAGICIAVANFLTYKSMETEQITKIGVLGEISAVMITLYGVIILHNPLNLIEETSILVIFIGSFFIMSTEHIKINKKLLPALFGNVLWAVYWVTMTISITSSGTFQVQMLTSRVVGSIILIALIYVIGLKAPKTENMKVNKAYLVLTAMAIGAGLIDGLGDGLFGLTLHLNVVAAGGAISASAPIFISIAAYFIYKDRLTKPQLVGLIAVILGAISLAIF